MNSEYIVLPEMHDLSETPKMNFKLELDIISKLYFLISFKETANGKMNVAKKKVRE